MGFGGPHGMWRYGGGKTETPASILLRKLLKHMFPYKFAMFVIITCIIVSSVTNLFSPYLLGLAIDNYIMVGDMNGLLRISALYFLAMVGNWVAMAVQGYAVSWIGQRLIYDLRNKLMEKIMFQSFKYHDYKRAGDLISTVINDTSILRESFISGIFHIVSDVFSLIGVIIAMYLLNVPLTLVTLLTLPVMLLIAYVFSRKFRQAYRRTREKIAEVTVRVQESISGIRVIQAFGREEDSQARFQMSATEQFEAQLQAGKLMAIFWPTVSFIGNIGTIVVLLYGGFLSAQGRLEVGVLVAFLAYVTRFMNPIMQLTNFYDMLQAALAASDRIFNVLESEVDVKDAPDAIELPRVKGDIKYENVWFEYVKGIPVLKNINLHIKPGEKIAIVGPTGSGKTTLVYLLARFYDVTSGSISIDGIDIRKVKQESLRKQIAFVPQDTFLFRGTIMDNIRIGKPDATDDEVIDVCKRLGIHEFIMRLPKGYDTDAGEAGRKLSTGERQLISFARAMLKDPPILVLDEALSAVDPKTEYMIKYAIRKLLENRTAIIIAHRLTLARDWDRIIVLHNGVIEEEGTHEELMRRQGFYYKLYTTQISEEIVVEAVGRDGAGRNSSS
ncbi:MAG: ABC transporter ATP-binding protein/permease [archaeon GBS-70-058]|nr:ABC transporter ATP-binding protein/permease [Candidatus Culexarchaeum nevadense]